MSQGGPEGWGCCFIRKSGDQKEGQDMSRPGMGVVTRHNTGVCDPEPIPVAQPDAAG